MTDVFGPLLDMSFLWVVVAIVLLGTIGELFSYGRRRDVLKKDRRLCFTCFVFFKGSRCPKCRDW
ncbi:MAG: hypothetical protein HYY37_04515 [Candidatus Aenigmarchaeota archaeon]|nr:hypothetical protein [Candidatus Aenigmarchaeota archaeon]